MASINCKLWAWGAWGIALAVLCSAASPVASAKGQSEKRVASESALPNAKRKIRKRTPGEVSRDLFKTLRNTHMPWQLYSRYVEYYNTEAEKILASVPPKKTAVRKRAELWAAYYRKLAKLVAAMGAQKKVIDGIRINNTDVPPADRRSVYKKAMKKHKELQNWLLYELRNPPNKRTESGKAHRSQ